jgi:subtilisin family serine protease
MTIFLNSEVTIDPDAARRQPAALLEAAAVDPAAVPGAVRAADGVAAAGELLVAGPEREGAADRLAGHGFAVVARAGSVIRMAKPAADMAEIERLCAALRGPGVELAPNYIVVAAPAVGKFAKAGPLPTACRPAGRSEGGRGVHVVVIDGAAPAETDGGLLTSAAGHAAFVASMVRQHAPQSTVRIVPVLDADGVGTDFDVAAALFDLAAADEPPALVNLSLTALAGTPPIAISAGLGGLSARHPGVLVVAAAGNDGRTEPAWPAAAKSVLAVGSPAAYSNHGYWVDFVVPAEGLVGAFVSGVRDSGGELVEHRRGYAAWSGTSFAAPQVTGMLAALLGRGLDPAEAVSELRRPAVTARHAG